MCYQPHPFFPLGPCYTVTTSSDTSAHLSPSHQCLTSPPHLRPPGYKDDEAGYDMVLARSASSKLDVDAGAKRIRQLVEAWPESKAQVQLGAEVATGTQ